MLYLGAMIGSAITLAGKEPHASHLYLRRRRHPRHQRSRPRRVPLADGTLVAAPVEEDSPLIPSLLTLSDVYGTGFHAAIKASVSPRTSVTVIGDGAVGLLAVLSARQL